MQKSSNIAYCQNTLYFLIPSLLSIIINVFVILHFIIKVNCNKKKNKLNSLDKLLFILSFIECAISLFWYLSIKIFENESEINNNFDVCQILGTFKLFYYIFDWLLVYYTISHLKNMILNPINYILKSTKKLTKYFFISGGIAIIMSITSYVMNIIGKSPILTCFLSLDFYFDENKNNTKAIIGLIIEIIILIIPIFIFIFGLIQIIIVCVNDSYKNDKENKRLFNKHLLHLIIYLIITVFVTIIFIVKFFNYNNIKDFTLFYFIFSLMICVSPLIAGVIRLYQTKIIISIYRAIKNKFGKKEKESLLSLSESTTFEEFESSAVEKFVMNIYISICFCLEKSLEVNEIYYEDINPNMNNETNKYKISKKEINKQLKNGHLINDRLVKSRNEFSISCVEFAPQIFKFLRQLDGLKEDFIVNSILPVNNKIGINETEGRGGSFFINTDDHEYILKTITFEEMEIMRNLVLNKMVNHFYNNNDSIICRIYGVYKISMHTGLFKEDEMYFILMKNVIGSFYDNLICKYDLKGSSLNRKVKYENMDTKVMKDLNFNEVEEVFLLSKNNSKKLLDIVIKDATFFSDLGIMDYSLLVGKISLNKKEVNFLFGNEHRKQSEMEFFNMIGKEREASEDYSFIENEDINNNNNKNGNDNKNDINQEIRFDDIKIKSLRKYFFPSLKWDVLYVMSIIDYFQLYNLQKNFETKYKQITKRVNANYISSVPPNKYKERFIEFVKKKSQSEKYLKYIYDPENKNDF